MELFKNSHFTVLLVLIALTVGDGVLPVVLFSKYTSKYAQFLNQGTAFVYCITSSSILAIRWYLNSRKKKNATETTESLLESPLEGEDEEIEVKKPVPSSVLILIGIFNGSGNFCQAMGQPHTPGLIQTLLSNLGVPLVIIFSAIFLRKLPSVLAATGGILIVAGGLVSGFGQLSQNSNSSSGSIVIYWYSCVLYASAQFFLAGEKVYEEMTFKKWQRVDVMVMFCYTLWTQFLLGFALYPLQTFQALGGLQLDSIPTVFWDGILCVVGVTPMDSKPQCGAFTAGIFWAYCVVDFCCYAFGLFVIQRGGATLMVIASAVALPLQQLVLCSPLLGTYNEYREHFSFSDLVALFLVLSGFVVYELCSKEGKTARDESK
eukprot:g2341.t1